MSIEDILNQNLLKLWENNYKNDSNILMPLLYGPLKYHALLFIGLNPSFSEQGFAQLFHNTEFDGLNPNEFYAWKNRKGLILKKQ